MMEHCVFCEKVIEPENDCFTTYKDDYICLPCEGK